jgi:hypothetical protein
MLQRTSETVSAALDGVVVARLVFENGVGDARLDGDVAPCHLFDAAFERGTPEVRFDGEMVAVRYPRLAWLLRTRAELSLSPRVSWAIEIDGGAAGLTAILRDVRVRSLQVLGGARQLSLALRRPSGTVPIRVEGGVERLFLRRPPSVAASVTIEGGATGLLLDDFVLGAVGGKLCWQTPGYEEASSRYEITVTGGAAGLTVARDPQEPTSPYRGFPRLPPALSR